MALRPHWKIMVWPVIVLLVTSPVVTYLVTKVPDNAARPWLRLRLMLWS